MSRAFVREDDGTGIEPPPEKVISPHRNLVTPRGLALIESMLAGLQAELTTSPDAARKAILQRDLVYWSARRSNAEIQHPPSGEAIGFGSRVVLTRDGKAPETVTIVGEDEAEPAAGLISWVAPFARKLMGLEEGDTVSVAFPRGKAMEVEIMRVENEQP